MFAFISSSIVMLFAAASSSGDSEFVQFWNKYLNYPGFEIWKFVNLGIFVFVIGMLAKKPLSDAFKQRRNDIRAELIKAEEEKKAALERLKAAEAKLAGLSRERDAILKNAQAEIDAEKERLQRQTESETAKLFEQTKGEITRLGQVTRAQLKRFSAEESIRIAEEKLRARVDDNADAALVKAGIQAIGGMN